jgi:ubiquinone biosynthesis protein UbiJ
VNPELVRPFEELLNRRIAGSSRARGLLAELAGRSLELRFTATPLRLRLSAVTGRIVLGAPDDQAADAVIEGTPLSFLRIAIDEPTRSIRAGGAQIHGDAEIAEGFRKLLEAARPDIEEELSRLVGDVAAHHLARVAREATRYGRHVAETLAQDTAEYLTEESRDLPPRFEVEEFLAGVDQLRESVDRLEARIAAAERHRSRT